ncbi:hypothetical protein RB653_008830 [Dictyostelium firmibasis]|uniref:N-acetyltransferase domain-containing protein n=1 Tax=Dictyostelium firmibasis TaxID=79012 RepID=A0AAN7YRZ6_9MYCE
MIEIDDEIIIVPYEPRFKNDFKYLGIEWISQFFKIEEEDIKVLEHPEENIINKGGYIIFAFLNGEIVGTCALLKSEEPEKYCYELAKMSVTPKAKGKQIGFLLGQSLINKAKQELNAKKIFLETNSILIPAIKLYEKLGFKSIPLTHSVYSRCDTMMELIL